MSPPPSAPLERSLYIGDAFGAILYGTSLNVFKCSVKVAQITAGIQIYMVFHSCYLLVTSKKGWRNGTAKFYISYGFIMLVLTAFALSANMVMGQLMWIEHRDFPGGPFAYYTEHSTLWINILGTAACIAGNYMNDALLVLQVPSLSSVTFIH